MKHCIISHHGELEYGSPKKPALAEAMALNLADNADAKMQTLTEILKINREMTGWVTTGCLRPTEKKFHLETEKQKRVTKRNFVRPLFSEKEKNRCRRMM